MGDNFDEINEMVIDDYGGLSNRLQRWHIYK
jgi:hypothetical protein